MISQDGTNRGMRSAAVRRQGFATSAAFGSITFVGLTGAILTGFTGINSNQLAVETIGNNVANVNTTAYKNSRALFETLMFHTTHEGTAPDGQQGGTNPVQFGFGSTLATTQRSFNQGSTERTGVVSDLAVEGEGFFILETATEGSLYTRDGAFTLNTSNELVAANGSFVQGFTASQDGTIESGSLDRLNIPLGELSEAGATTLARLSGNLNASSEMAATGAVSVSTPLTATGGEPASATTALDSLTDSEGVALFNTGDVIEIRGVKKGGLDIPTTQFVVGSDGSTYGELAAFLETTFGIDTSDSAAGAPGVTIGDGTIDPAGALIVRSNGGDVNAIELDASSIRNGTTGAAPFTFSTTPSTGEGTTTSFLVFDSLGTPLEVRLRLVLQSRSDEGNTWGFTAESPNGLTAAPLLGQGTVSFDPTGRFVASTGTQISIPRGESGAINPIVFNLDFGDMTGLTSIAGVSTVSLSSQDGFPEGILTGYTIDPDGVINGTFSNGQARVLGQVALATFANNRGLVAQSENTFVVGVNSGQPVVRAPQTGAAGQIRSGELEQSNVDLARELIGLITASTGFSAASRTVRTADDMLQELMLLVN